MEAGALTPEGELRRDTSRLLTGDWSPVQALEPLELGGSVFRAFEIQNCR